MASIKGTSNINHADTGMFRRRKENREEIAHGAARLLIEDNEPVLDPNTTAGRIWKKINSNEARRARAIRARNAASAAAGHTPTP